jgi:hypothetical protein
VSTSLTVTRGKGATVTIFFMSIFTETEKKTKKQKTHLQKKINICLATMLVDELMQPPKAIQVYLEF